MSAPRRNLELKALDPDPSRTLRAALDLGATDARADRSRTRVSQYEALNITGDLMVARGYSDRLKEPRG